MIILLSILLIALLVGVLVLFILPLTQNSPLIHIKAKALPLSISIVTVLILINLLNSSVQFAREGHVYYVLSPTGKRTMISSPGVYFAMPGSYIQEWERYIDVKAVPVDDNGKITQPTEGIEGVIAGGVPIRFSDKVNATMYIATRFEIPVVDEQFFKLVETYKHPKNLVNNILIPTITEQGENVSLMFSGEDYVNGAATDFRMTVEDALKNGGFVTQRVEEKDTLWVDNFTPELDISKRKREIKEIRSINKNKKVLENGIPKRNPHEINTNKIFTASVIVESVKLDPEFEKKLTQQRDISIQKILEIQKIETAKAAQQRIIAEGERDKAAERAKQEIAQLGTLTLIETQVKEEESKRQLAEIAKKTAKEEAEALLIKERAQAEANRLKVAAGLTPQEKAEWEYKTAVGVAEKIANITFPQYMITGGDGKSNTALESLIGAAMAKQLLDVKK